MKLFRDVNITQQFVISLIYCLCYFTYFYFIFTYVSVLVQKLKYTNCDMQNVINLTQNLFHRTNVSISKFRPKEISRTSSKYAYRCKLTFLPNLTLHSRNYYITPEKVRREQWNLVKRSFEIVLQK